MLSYWCFDPIIMYMYQLINIELYLKLFFLVMTILSYAQWYIWQFPYVHNKD